MTLTCFKCAHEFPCIKFLICHLKGIHVLTEPCELVCGQTGCARLFTSFHSFRKHISSHMEVKKTLQETSVAPLQIAIPENDTPDVELSSDDDDADAALSLDITEFFGRRGTFIPAAKFLLDLTSAAIPLSTINSIRDGLDEMLSVIAGAAQQKVQEAFSRNGLQNDACASDAMILIAALGLPFKNIDTVTKLSSYLERVDALNVPTEIVLGQRWETKIDRRARKQMQVQVNDTFMYIPISKTLKYILKHPECWSVSATNNDEPNDSGIMFDYQDGANYQSHRLRRPLPSDDGITDELVVQLYYDDVETVNPIGTKASIHKLGAFYFILKNFPAIFNSNLANVHLVALSYSSDIKKYGMNAILRVIVDDLKSMEDGFYIDVRGENAPRHVRCILGQITGDNLGLHACLGYVEGFTGDYCCDICTANKNTMQTSITEIPALQRSVAQYEEIVKKIAAQHVNKAQMGVKNVSILKELKYYHPAKNDTGDIMHDILEGVGPLEIKLILHNFIYVQRLFDLVLWNDQLRHFPYGPTLSDKKPSLLTESRLKEDGSLLGQRSSQMMTLIMVLPLIIGDKVPSDSIHWKLLLLLIRICNIVFSPAVHKSDTTYLAALIAEHHSLFRSLFTDKSVIQTSSNDTLPKPYL